MGTGSDRQRVMVTLTARQVARLDAMARDTGVSRSGLTALAVRDFLDARGYLDVEGEKMASESLSGPQRGMSGTQDVADGWHDLDAEGRRSAWVERGRVIRGTMPDHNGQIVPCWPYRWDESAGMWHNVSGRCTLADLEEGRAVLK